MSQIHSLINKPEGVKDLTGNSCITALIDADSILYIVGWHYKDTDNTDHVRDAVDRFITEILVKTKARQYAGFFSSKITFRNNIYSAYKANRAETHPGIEKWKPYITEYCIQEWKFEKLSNYEADDAVAELHRVMQNTVICSPDKDLKQVPGNNFNYGKDVHSVIEPAEALKNWAVQMLIGDTGDNIKGIPGMGKVGAAKLLVDVDFTDAQAADNVVRKAYFKKFGDLVEYELHCRLIGLGLPDAEIAYPYINTFELDNAASSEYIRVPEDQIGQDAEDLFGSW